MLLHYTPTHTNTVVFIVLSTLTMIYLVSQVMSFHEEVVTDNSFWKYKL